MSEHLRRSVGARDMYFYDYKITFLIVLQNAQFFAENTLDKSRLRDKLLSFFLSMLVIFRLVFLLASYEFLGNGLFLPCFSECNVHLVFAHFNQ